MPEQTPEQKKRMGRPPGTGAPPEEQRKPRSIRLNDARWAKLQALGSDWLENAIDSAPEPAAAGASNDQSEIR